MIGEDGAEGLEGGGELGWREGESEGDDGLDLSDGRVGTFSLDIGLFLTVLMDGLGKSEGMNSEDGTLFALVRTTEELLVGSGHLEVPGVEGGVRRHASGKGHPGRLGFVGWNMESPSEEPGMAGEWCFPGVCSEMNALRMPFEAGNPWSSLERGDLRSPLKAGNVV